jgi:hypothetical protein
MHSLRRQPLPKLLIHLKERLGHSVHLQGTNPVIHTEPHNSNEYALVRTVSGIGSLSAALAKPDTNRHTRECCVACTGRASSAPAALPPYITMYPVSRHNEQ